MTDDRLFALAKADHSIIVTPQRNLTEFDFAQIESEASEVLGRISKDGGPNVVVDFSKIDYTGSTALSFFTRLFKKTRCRGGEMAFCNVSPVEREVLEVTRLDTLWPIYDSLGDALAAVSKSAMRSSDTTWIVVADRAIARIFEQRGGSVTELHAVVTLRHPESRERMSDAVSDQPGSFRGGAIAGSESGQPNLEHDHRMSAAFAREVTTYLEGARQRGSFSRMVLIAAPMFLGSLRDSMPSSIRKLIEHEIAKDYTHLDGADVLAHLGDLTATA